MLTTLTSCLGAVSLDKYGYVLSVGVDTGKAYKYSVTFLLETESESPDEGSSAASNIISAEGDNIYEAAYIAESCLPFRLNFSRVEYCIIGKDVAATGGIDEFFSISWADLRLRTSANLILSTSTAKEFLDGLTYSDNTTPAKLESSLIDFYERDGLTAMISISDYLTAVHSPYYDAVMPTGSVDVSADSEKQTDTTDGKVRTGGMTSYTLGSCIFSGSMLKGVLSARESRLFMLAEGDMKGAVIQFTLDGGDTFSLRLSNIKKPSVSASFNEKSISLHYYIPLSAELIQFSAQSEKSYFTEEMKAQVKSYLENALSRLFYDCRDLGCDSFGTGREAVKLFTRTSDWENFNYKSRLLYTECDFSVDIKIVSDYVAAEYE